MDDETVKHLWALREVNKSLVTIESAKWVGPFPAVLTGEIVATNEAAFHADILTANKDPYGAGWLVRIRSGPSPHDPLLSKSIQASSLASAAAGDPRTTSTEARSP